MGTTSSFVRGQEEDQNVLSFAGVLLNETVRLRLASVSPDTPSSTFGFVPSLFRELDFLRAFAPSDRHPYPPGLLWVLLPSSGAGWHTPGVRTDVPSLPPCPSLLDCQNVLSAVPSCNLITSRSLLGIRRHPCSQGSNSDGGAAGTAGTPRRPICTRTHWASWDTTLQRRRADRWAL